MGRKKPYGALRQTGEDSYFAASNSKNGFYSYYSACFDDPQIDRVYAIKGGPGTGKSFFLRTVADCGEKNGWHAERIYCSSDPDSLDGVILRSEGEGIALLDATAPHVYEPTRVGFRENLINLGEFWDEDVLRERSSEIQLLDAQKKAAYRRAYRYLSAYGEMAEVRDAAMMPYYRNAAIESLAARLMQGVENGQTFSSHVALMRSVGMRGAVAFDTYLAQAKRVFFIEDCRGSAYRLTEALYRRAAEKRLRVRVSKDPILYDRVDGLLLCDCGYAFVVRRGEPIDNGYSFKRISMRRFVETARMRAVRGTVNYAERMQDAMLSGAMDALAEVRTAHFRLEALYSAAMDFSKKEEFTKKFCDSLFHLQNG